MSPRPLHFAAIRRPRRLVVAILLATIVGHTAAESLPDVVDRVLLQQPSVRSALALLNAADAQITQARSDFLPTASLSHRNGTALDETQGRPVDRTTRRSDAALRWNIFNGGADFNRVRSARFSRDAAEADLDETLEQVAVEISETYLDIVRLRHAMSSLEATIARQEKLEQRIRQRVETGRIPPSEADLMHSRLIQNRSQLGLMRAQLGTAEFRFLLITGQPPDATLIMPALLPKEPEGGIAALIQRIKQYSPALRAARQRAAARDADIGVARGSLFPSVELQYAKRLNNETTPVPVTDTAYNQELRVSLDIPLGGRNIARHTEARERHRSAEAEAEQVDNELSREAGDLYRQWQEARELAPLLEQRVLATQRVAAAYELQFEAGRRSLNEVSTIQDELFDAQRNLIENSARQTLLYARVLGMAGELRSSLRTRYRAAPIASELLGTTPLRPADAPQPEKADISPSEEIAAEVTQRLEAWRNSWAARDYPAYRQYYRDDFRPADGSSTADWESNRRNRLRAAINPSIRVEQLSITANNQSSAAVTFTQHYQSGEYRDSVRKEQTWVRTASGWQIAAETSAPLNR